jgi:serine/threonine protein kinase
MDVGSEFSNYRVIEHIGRGGMADVWSARDKRLARTVAVKTIAGDLSSEMNPVTMFEREAQTIAALEHPHILPIYEFGEFEGQLYIVMRYVSGGSLEDMLEKGPLSVEETLRVVRSVGQALDYAHQSKVIHLDLKPSNILLDSYQSPYLADFGLATMMGPEGRAQNPGSGTLLYMAPEQLTADMLDSRADIYSFAILVFHMLTGQLPFDGAVPLAIRQLQSGDMMPDVTRLRAGLPDVVNVVLQHASMLDSSSRAQSLKDVMNQLEHALGGGRRLVLSSDTRGMPSNNPETRGISTLPLDQLISGPLDGLVSRPVQPPTAPVAPEDIDALVTGPLEGLISRPVQPPPTAPVTPADLDALVTGPIDGLISRPVQPGDLDALVTGPIEDLVKRTEEIPSAARDMAGLEKLISGPIGNLISKIGQAHVEPAAPPESLTFADEAVREAYDIYVRARRAFAGGQGKFILGVTDFILIADTYADAQAHGLELDDSGLAMLLRGALEYDYQLSAWWGRADDENRRWVSLHALRSENAPARQRAIDRLMHLPDTDPPQIPRLVGQALNVETNRGAMLAGLHLLGARSPLPARIRAWWETLGLATARDWRPLAYSREIDALLARRALDDDEPEAAALAARVIGRVRSESAAMALSEARRGGKYRAALARQPDGLCVALCGRAAVLHRRHGPVPVSVAVGLQPGDFCPGVRAHGVGRADVRHAAGAVGAGGRRDAAAAARVLDVVAAGDLGIRLRHAARHRHLGRVQLSHPGDQRSGLACAGAGRAGRGHRLCADEHAPPAGHRHHRDHVCRAVCAGIHDVPDDMDDELRRAGHHVFHRPGHAGGVGRADVPADRHRREPGRADPRFALAAAPPPPRRLVNQKGPPLRRRAFPSVDQHWAMPSHAP